MHIHVSTIFETYICMPTIKQLKSLNDLSATRCRQKYELNYLATLHYQLFVVIE